MGKQGPQVPLEKLTMFCLLERDLGDMADTLRKKGAGGSRGPRTPLEKEANEDYNCGEIEKICAGQILDI